MPIGVESLVGFDNTFIDRRRELDAALREKGYILSEDKAQFTVDYMYGEGLRMGEVRHIDLSELTHHCVALLRQHPDAEGVEVVVEGTDTPVPLVGDPDLLHRALFNLMLNGAQFAGDGGTVTVAIADLSSVDNPRGTGMKGAVSMTVADSGPGVDQDVGAPLDDVAVDEGFGQIVSDGRDGAGSVATDAGQL